MALLHMPTLGRAALALGVLIAASASGAVAGRFVPAKAGGGGANVTGAGAVAGTTPGLAAATMALTVDVAAALAPVRTDLDAARKRIVELEAEVALRPTEERVVGLDRALREQAAAAAVLEAKAAAIEARIDEEARRHGEEVKALEASLARVKEQLEKAEEQLAQWRLVVQAIEEDSFIPNPMMPRPKLDALVLDVENPPAGQGPGSVVILDVGGKQGISRGDQLAVVREGEPIAKLRVEKVFGDHGSGARIVKLKKGESLKARDRATTKLP